MSEAIPFLIPIGVVVIIGLVTKIAVLREVRKLEKRNDIRT